MFSENSIYISNRRTTSLLVDEDVFVREMTESITRKLYGGQDTDVSND